MDATVVFTMFATAIASLSGAIVFLFKLIMAREDKQDVEESKQWSERVKEWRDLYDTKCVELNEVRKVSVEEAQANASTMREVADVLKALPRRREDWIRLTEQTAP